MTVSKSSSNGDARRQWQAPDVYTALAPPRGNIHAAPWTPPPPKPLVFTNAKLVDVAANKIIDNVTVVVENGHFTTITTEALDVFPANARIIDLNGLYLCPGLVDCHIHVNLTDGSLALGYVHPYLRGTYTLKAMLARGFTTVRDVGGGTFAQAQAVEQWLTPGPRLFQGGAILSQTGGHGDFRKREEPSDSACCDANNLGLTVLVDGVAKATEEARNLMRQGAQHIKICSSGGISSPTNKVESTQFTAEEIRAITGVCKDMGGTLVTSHAYTVAAIRRAIDNGVRGIEHGNFLDRDTAKLMAETGTFYTPTLIAYSGKQRPPWNAAIPDYMQKKGLLVGEAGRTAIKIAEEEGVCICFGSDCSWGMGYLQSEEFTIRHSLLPSHRVVAQATINGAKQINDPKVGTIASGNYGDCLVLVANPLEDCRVLDHANKGIWGVIKEGRVVVAKEEFAEKLEGGVDIHLDIDL
ncbi:hypothetical protein BCR39DRAFT_587286 [Naematelia encephala]|uniref:Amidohydrolase-related domain-containing protein n=1 Tax=Naematelia encephala TaxID=71784 RepID=A0A1Y2BAI0_9TREE|nr:hypothetical protein BCR39DRAFT_587286 [Naematelia encephala]